jgi:hypothetical protein
MLYQIKEKQMAVHLSVLPLQTVKLFLMDGSVLSLVTVAMNSVEMERLMTLQQTTARLIIYY